MSRPSPRLSRRAQRDFPANHVDEAISALSTIPESLPLADQQSAERLQAAALLLAEGNLEQLHKAITLARRDWRDLLVAAGLANGDWPSAAHQQVRCRVDRILWSPPGNPPWTT